MNTKVILGTLIVAVLFIGTASASCNANHHATFEPILDYEFSHHWFTTELRNVINEVRHDPYYNVLIISDSANFECCNQAVAYHILDHGRVVIWDETGAVSYTTLKALSRYECRFFEDDMPLHIKTDGSMCSNMDNIKAEWL